MKVDEKEVKSIARLAKLTFNKKELSRLQEEMNKILDYMEKLNQLDTEKIDPIYYVFEYDTPFRRDESETSFTLEKALKNAPQKDDGFFLVPKVKD